MSFLVRLDADLDHADLCLMWSSDGKISLQKALLSLSGSEEIVKSCRGAVKNSNWVWMVG